MPCRESGGRLRSLTGSGPEGSSPGELRRVARLLFCTPLRTKTKLDRRPIGAVEVCRTRSPRDGHPQCPALPSIVDLLDPPMLGDEERKSVHVWRRLPPASGLDKSIQLRSQEIATEILLGHGSIGKSSDFSRPGINRYLELSKPADCGSEPIPFGRPGQVRTWQLLK